MCRQLPLQQAAAEALWADSYHYSKQLAEALWADSYHYSKQLLKPYGQTATTTASPSSSATAATEKKQQVEVHKLLVNQNKSCPVSRPVQQNGWKATRLERNVWRTWIQGVSERYDLHQAIIPFYGPTCFPSAKLPPLLACTSRPFRRLPVLQCASRSSRSSSPASTEVVVFSTRQTVRHARALR